LSKDLGNEKAGDANKYRGNGRSLSVALAAG